MTEHGHEPDLEKLAEEAKLWDSRALTPKNWEDATDAVPMAASSQLISIRLPKKLIVILREFAAREKIGYQVLMKRWLDDRIRAERRSLERSIRLDQPKIIRMAASQPACFSAPKDRVSHVKSEVG